jgi:hypothetical protein
MKTNTNPILVSSLNHTSKKKKSPYNHPSSIFINMDVQDLTTSPTTTASATANSFDSANSSKIPISNFPLHLGHHHHGHTDNHYNHDRDIDNTKKKNSKKKITTHSSSSGIFSSKTNSKCPCKTTECTCKVGYILAIWCILGTLLIGSVLFFGIYDLITNHSGLATETPTPVGMNNSESLQLNMSSLAVDKENNNNNKKPLFAQKKETFPIGHMVFVKHINISEFFSIGIIDTIPSSVVDENQNSDYSRDAYEKDEDKEEDEKYYNRPDTTKQDPLKYKKYANSPLQVIPSNSRKKKSVQPPPIKDQIFYIHDECTLIEYKTFSLVNDMGKCNPSPSSVDINCCCYAPLGEIRKCLGDSILWETQKTTTKRGYHTAATTRSYSYCVKCDIAMKREDTFENNQTLSKYSWWVTLGLSNGFLSSHQNNNSKNLDFFSSAECSIKINAFCLGYGSSSLSVLLQNMLLKFTR